MQKNKEDDFLGDSITKNIKYADNVWQAQGTVDRGSCYTKESILDLIFEKFNYNKKTGDYKDYVARNSVSSFNNSSPYMGAKLSHDIYLIDASTITSSAITCTKNIFSLKAAARNGIGIINPIYDEKSKVKKIYLIDPSNLDPNVTVRDVLKYLIPSFYTTTMTNVDIDKKLRSVLDRYLKRIKYQNIIDATKNGNEPTESLIPFFKNLVTSDILDLTMSTFLEELGKANVSINGKTKSVRDIFIEDFTINLHDPDSIKLPFSLRGDDDESAEDIRTFETRFLLNFISDKLDTVNSSNLYFENISDLIEEALFVDGGALEGFSSLLNSGDVPTDKGLASDITTSGKIYSHLNNLSENISKKTKTDSLISILNLIVKNAAYYSADVYTNYSTENKPKNSWGIHFVNEETTSNLFQDEEDAYSLFTRILLGYNLVDALLYNRTFLGGFLYLIQASESASPIDVPMSLRTFNSLPARGSNQDFYYSVSSLNSIYKASRGLSVILTEVSDSSRHSYDLADEIKEWLRNECFVFKGRVYGDFVEELNFMQDLTPESSVKFGNLRLKKTEIPYQRYQDSKYEVPYIEQTWPLLNQSYGERDLGVVGTDVLSGIGNLLGKEVDTLGNQTRNTTPPFLYDFDKGNQDFELDISDPRQKSGDSLQRVNTKKGNLNIEGRINSPTIDELWTFLKFLTESDGSGTDKNLNERLPKFLGVKRSYIGETIESGIGGEEIQSSKIKRNRLNPLYSGESEGVIDIIGWKPVTKEESRVHWDEKDTTNPELQFGGFSVTRFIEKIYDYKVLPFSRRSSFLDGNLYEFNTEVSSDFNNVTGYLEKLYNSATLVFDLPQIETTPITSASVRAEILSAHPLEDSIDTGDKKVFSKENDSKLNTSKTPVHSSIQRQKAFRDIARILNYHLADGSNEVVDGKDTSYHNHFKKYLENPKNLKEIERDLETIRQNLQTLAEFMVASYPSMGYADRAKNRGTLHQLHKNAYDFLSTWLLESNNFVAGSPDLDFNTTVKIKELTDTLNNIRDSLVVTDLDKKVVFDDGDYETRYLKEKYDHSIIDLSSNPVTNTRGLHPMYRPNETLLSEVYLAADGTWRSIHEHTVLPVIYDEH